MSTEYHETTLKPTVLICYSGKDRCKIIEEKEKIRNIGIEVTDYFDGIGSHTDWREWVSEQFVTSDYIVVFLSNNMEPVNDNNTVATALELITSATHNKEKLFIVEIDDNYKSSNVIINSIKSLLPNRWFSYKIQDKYLEALESLKIQSNSQPIILDETNKQINTPIFPHFLIDDKSFSNKTEDKQAVISLVLLDLTVSLNYILPFSLPIEIKAKYNKFLEQWLYFTPLSEYSNSTFKFLTIYNEDPEEFFKTRKRLEGYDEIKNYYRDKDITTYTNIFPPLKKSMSTTLDIIKYLDDNEAKTKLSLSTDAKRFLDYCLQKRRNEWITYRYLKKYSYKLSKQNILDPANSYLQYLYIVSHIRDRVYPSLVVHGIYNNSNPLIELWLREYSHPIYTGARIKILFKSYFGRLPTNSSDATNMWTFLNDKHQELLMRIRVASVEYLRSIMLMSSIMSLPNNKSILDLPTYLMATQLNCRSNTIYLPRIDPIISAIDKVTSLTQYNYDAFNKTRAIELHAPCITLM